MKTIGIFKFDADGYSELIEKLKSQDISFKTLANNQIEDDIDLYIFDLDKPEEFESIKDFQRPFIVISSLNDSAYLRKSLKYGALDYISKPFTNLELTIKRIERVLEKNGEINIQTPISSKNDKVIDTEIKRAHRGKYPLVLASLTFEVQLNKEVVAKTIDKLRSVLRDSDSCLIYPDDRAILILPFVDNDGIVVISRKIIELLNSIGIKSYCLCARYPEDGGNREDLIKNLGKGFDTRNFYK